VQEILDKFKFGNQIDTMIEADILDAVIQKFVSKDINLSPKQNGNLPGLDNHAMGTIFEELVRRFNEANNEEAGEHWTPRDVVELMADLVFAPIADQIKDATYSCYDGACGTDGMLTVAQGRLNRIAEETGKKVSIHLFGQELQPETYAIAKADMMLKGDGEEAMHIAFGSTLSNDQHASRSFDFMLANPPYGKSWKVDAEKMASGKKKEILDTRFNAATEDGEPLAMIPRSSDGQLLFLLNNISRMKQDTPLGSRIAEVHNGSSLFTGDAGSGESNARRFMIENDMVEAIIALPEKMFYNTGIGTYVWVLSNRKEDRRKGKIQLIDATGIKTPLRKNMGEKNCELSPEQREEIVRIFMAFEESEISKIFPNSEFGYWKVSVQQPMLDEQGNPIRDKKGRIQPDKSKNDTEIIPFNYEGGIEGFMDAEVRPYAPGAFIDPKGRKKTARWSPSTIESILTNEKYKGDAILQNLLHGLYQENLRGERWQRNPEVLRAEQSSGYHQRRSVRSDADGTGVAQKPERKLHRKKAVFPHALYAEIVAPSMAARSGTARTNTVARSGAATISMKATRSARRRM